MDIKVIDSLTTEEVKKEDNFEHHQLEGNLQREIAEKAIGQVLGLETPSSLSKYQDNIRTLLEYATSETEDHSPESLKWTIRSLELKLGSPPFAEDRVKFISRYAYLLNEGRRLEREKQKFERKLI